MYSLSSADALTAFIQSPRTYLLPPSPRIPCKICILGPPTSGKTTLAQRLAEHYKAMVKEDSAHINVHTYACIYIWICYLEKYIECNLIFACLFLYRLLMFKN